jgi:hypothetical protein
MRPTKYNPKLDSSSFIALIIPDSGRRQEEAAGQANIMHALNGLSAAESRAAVALTSHDFYIAIYNLFSPCGGGREKN